MFIGVKMFSPAKESSVAITPEAYPASLLDKPDSISWRPFEMAASRSMFNGILEITILYSAINTYA